MRVLAIVNNFPWPGDIDGIFNLRQLLAVRERGHDVRVIRCVPFAPPFGQRWKRYTQVPSRYKMEGLEVRTLRAVIPPRSYALTSLAWQTRRAIAREVLAFNANVIHVHGLLPAGVLARGASVPFVLTAHGSEAYVLPWVRRDITTVARSVVSEAARCVAVSDFVASHLRRLGARDVGVVFNGADERVFYPRDRATMRKKLGLDPDRPTILFAGHVNHAKGIAELQSAIPRLEHLRPQCAIVGRGPLETALRKALLDAQIPAVFPGVVPHDELAEYMAACDVLVLPSHAEGLPTTLCEAMLVGRAVVATAVGGIPEIVSDGHTGFVVKRGDVDALGERLWAVLADHTLRDRFEREALAFAREKLTWQANARAYESIYESAIRSPVKAAI